jgi:hypothetical protein
MSEKCEHVDIGPGPRMPLLYGSAPTEVCAKCGMWRDARRPRDSFQYPEGAARLAPRRRTAESPSRPRWHLRVRAGSSSATTPCRRIWKARSRTPSLRLWPKSARRAPSVSGTSQPSARRGRSLHRSSTTATCTKSNRRRSDGRRSSSRPANEPPSRRSATRAGRLEGDETGDIAVTCVATVTQESVE